jgi:hypothetical protein
VGLPVPKAVSFFGVRSSAAILSVVDSANEKMPEANRTAKRWTAALPFFPK